MKKTLLSLFFLAIGTMVFAQSATINTAVARQATDELVQYYSLDAKQEAKVYQIQLHKLKNKAELEALKTSDPTTYHKKKRDLYYGTEGSVRLYLNKEQLKLFQKRQTAHRKKVAEKRATMQKQGASAADIEQAIADIDY